jgi:ribosomal protein S18 acetylase RimI-like enzyme
MNGYELRAICDDDYEAAMALWNRAPGVRTGESREDFARILQRNPGLGSVATVDGAMAGAVLACHDGRRGYLYHLAVAEPYRNQGMARAMVERSLAGLAAEGIARCSIHLIVDNESGAAFWQKIGWRERVDLRIMAKDL